MVIVMLIIIIKPFSTNAPLLYPLKTSDGHIKWENSALFRLVFPVWNRQKQSSEVFCQRGIRKNLQN